MKRLTDLLRFKKNNE